jgi:hypothetical protein
LPCSICGTNILGFHHSMKSTETSSCRSDTKVVAGMCRVVLDTTQDGRPPSVVASSARSRCSSCNHWEELELDAVMEQLGFKVLHTLSEDVVPSLLSMLLPPAKVPKRPSKPLDSHQDEMLCHHRFKILSACRRRHILDPLCLHRGVHVDHNQDQLIQLIVQPK